jgi:hypothetical protein
MLRNSGASQDADHHPKIGPHKKVIGFRTIHALHCSSLGPIRPLRPSHAVIDPRLPDTMRDVDEPGASVIAIIFIPPIMCGDHPMA